MLGNWTINNTINHHAIQFKPFIHLLAASAMLFCVLRDIAAVVFFYVLFKLHVAPLAPKGRLVVNKRLSNLYNPLFALLKIQSQTGRPPFVPFRISLTA